MESVRAYFEHFTVLEIDYTFYSPLLDKVSNCGSQRIISLMPPIGMRYEEA